MQARVKYDSIKRFQDPDPMTKTLSDLGKFVKESRTNAKDARAEDRLVAQNKLSNAASLRKEDRDINTDKLKNAKTRAELLETAADLGLNGEDLAKIVGGFDDEQIAGLSGIDLGKGSKRKKTEADAAKASAVEARAKAKEDRAIAKEKRDVTKFDTEQEDLLESKELDDTWDSLTSLEKAQARSLSKEIYGARGTSEIKKVRNREIASMMVNDNMTSDNIRDELRYAKESKNLDLTIRGTINNLFPTDSRKRASVLEVVDDALASGDVEAIKNTLKRATIESAPSTKSKDRMYGLERTVDFFKNMQSKLDALALPDKDGNPGVDTGIFRGTYDDIAQRIGKLGNRRRQVVATEILNSFFEFRQEKTGAVFTDSESRSYGKVYPGTDKDPELNAAIIQGTTNFLNNSLENEYKNLMGRDKYTKIFKENYIEGQLARKSEEAIKKQAKAEVPTYNTISEVKANNKPGTAYIYKGVTRYYK